MHKMHFLLHLLVWLMQSMNGGIVKRRFIFHLVLAVVHSGSFIDACQSVTGYNFAVYAGGSCYVNMKTMYGQVTFTMVRESVDC